MSLELLGDKWSLLIVRDMMVRGFSSFKEFQESGEGIATNILTDRLQRLEQEQIIVAEIEPADRRKINYRLTEKGIDLAPVLLELLIWGARHRHPDAPHDLVRWLENDRQAILSEVRKRWKERDPTPILPKFPGAGIAAKSQEKGGKRKQA